MPDAGTLRRPLYPAIEPYATGALSVSRLHTLYYEEVGRADGLPAVALHGGPGGGISPDMRRFFDPDRWRVVLFDQRGCGRSVPHADLTENTTWDLVADMEKLREKLGIEKWLVFGGSWGSTLALTYAAMHPERVLGLVLRGIFLVTQHEIQWFYQNGASNLFPDAHDRYKAPIPEAERGDLITAYHQRLTHSDRATRIEAARAWAGWEGETLSLQGPKGKPTRFDEDRFVEAFARIECHYFVNRGFFPEDGWLLKQAYRFAHIPGWIAHGRYDVVTPLSSAWALTKVWPSAQLDIIPDAGHASLETGTVDSLVRATDRFADQLSHSP
jgi:proline iminopeptidase